MEEEVTVDGSNYEILVTQFRFQSGVCMDCYGQTRRRRPDIPETISTEMETLWLVVVEGVVLGKRGPLPLLLYPFTGSRGNRSFDTRTGN